MADTAAAKRSPLHDRHVAAGGKLVPFAGWELPVRYSGVVEEHLAVRRAAGLFDVSHMGEIRVTGAGAEAFLQRMTPNDVAKLRPGRAHYSGLLSERGTYLDDLLVFRFDADDFLLVVNAVNEEKCFDWLRSHAPDGLELTNESDAYALLALQGPASAEILQGLTEAPLDKLRYYRFLARAEVAGVPVTLSRTGYTGEDGFELFVEPRRASELWRALLEAGAGRGLVPAGLGARDTLRLEAAMALYGHEIDEQTTPLEAGLAWVVKLDKGEFIGRSALARQRDEGVGRQLVGFELLERGIARQGHALVDGGREVGRVTSGTWSPSFEKAIGMGYLPPALAAEGGRIEVEVRGRRLEARIVGLPFYRRKG